MDLLKCCHVVIVTVLCVKQVFGQVPPGLVLKDSTAGCHGNSGEDILKVNATCNAGNVLAINEVTMGAKPAATNCPLYWNSTFNVDCCTNEAADCTFPFYNNNQYHETCNGKEECTSTTQHQHIECDNFNGTYGALGQFSNYLFLDFYCVPDDHIVDMCTTASTTAETDTVYLWNQGFTTTSIATTDTDCECSVEIDNCDSDIQVYKLYRQLAGNISEATNSSDGCKQDITVYDADIASLLTWNCDNNNLNFEMDTVASTYININLKNQHTTSDGKFWLGFKASMSSNITINCPAQPQQNCVISTTTSTVQTTTTTEPPSTTTEPPSTTTEPPSTTTEPPSTTTEPPSTTTDPPSTSTQPPSTTTQPPSTTTTDPISTISFITTPTDSPPITPEVTPSPAGLTSGPGSNDQGDLYMILVIILSVICLVLIIAIVKICICWRKQRNKPDSKDIENPHNPRPQPEVARTDYKNSKHEFSPHLPPLARTLPVSSSKQEKVVPNGVTKSKTTDAGCQTQSTLPKLTDVTCQTAPTPMKGMNSISCQTDSVSPIIASMSKDVACQINLEARKIEKEDIVAKINCVDVATQTENKRKHKNLNIRMTNKVCPDDDVANINEILPQADTGNNTEDVIGVDDPVILTTEDNNQAEHPKKRKKKKKKKHDRRHDGGDLDHLLLEVAPVPEREDGHRAELHDSNPVAPIDERFVVPERNIPTPHEVSDADDSDVVSNRDVQTLNETEERYLKHRKSMVNGFYSSEISDEKLMKFLRKSERKKHKKKRQHTQSEPQ